MPPVDAMPPRPHWLTLERVVAYARITLVVVALAALALLLRSQHLLDERGTPIGADFITFWAASHLGLQGQAASAYNVDLLFAAERLAVPGLQKHFAWFYPPTFHLLVLPLALLPYAAALAGFVLATLAPYVAVFRRVLRERVALLCLFAFPGLWVNAMHGQNAFLTAALAAGALLQLERRPVLAGVCIGLLSVKPHLALLFPLLLLACGAWRALAAAALTAAALLALSTLVLGTPSLQAFLASLALARQAVESGALPWNKMPSTFVMLRSLGLAPAAAYAGQALVSCAAALALWRLWRGAGAAPFPLRAAGGMLAALLASPYLFDYDLAWLAFAIAWLTAHGLQHGWRRGERELLLAAWALPAVVPGLATLAGVQLAPLLLAALLWMVCRRAAASQAPATLPKAPRAERWGMRQWIMFCAPVLATVWACLAVGIAYRHWRLPFGAATDGLDFVAFWAASYLAQGGHPGDAYTFALFEAAQRVPLPGLSYAYPWFYPPTFQMLLLPLASMPLMGAYLSFMVPTVAGYVAVFWQAMQRRPLALLLLATFPALWMNIIVGQNGALTAMLAGGALLVLERRPVLAGVLIGLLACKPHLGVLFPVALLATRQWRTIAAAAVTAGAMALASVAVLGLPVLHAFIASIPNGSAYIESIPSLWFKTPTIFSALRMLGVQPSLAHACNGAAALAAVVLTWVLWRRHERVPLRLRAAWLMVATFFVSPYCFFYDLAWLAFAMGWLVLEALEHGWLRGERVVLLLAWAMPAAMVPLSEWMGTQPAPLVLAALAAVTWRRAWVQARQVAQDGPQQGPVALTSPAASRSGA